MTMTMDDDGAILVHLTNPGGIVGGTGVANQITYWTATDTIGGDAGLTYDPATDSLTIAGHTAMGGASAVNAGIVLFLKEAAPNNTSLDGAIFVATTHATVGGAYQSRALYIAAESVVDAGVTNTSTTVGFMIQALRNTGALAASDAGTMNKMQGANIGAGHYNTAAVTPTTNEVTGVYISSYHMTGTIGTLRDIQILDGPGGGTVTTRYGIHIAGLSGSTVYAIYSEGDNVSYLAGSLGIGVVPPNNKVEIRSTTEPQFRVAYDAGRYVTMSHRGNFNIVGGNYYRFKNAGNDQVVILGNGRVGIPTVTPLAQLHVDQGSASGTIPVLYLDQGDVSEPFTNYVGTSAASAANSLSSWTTGNAAQGHIQIDVNGTKRWLKFYDDPTS